MVSIQNKLDRLEKLEKQIEQEKEKIHSDFGEVIIHELGIDYELLSTKKEIKEAVQEIKNAMSTNPFQTENHAESSSDMTHNSDETMTEPVNDYDTENS